MIVVGRVLDPQGKPVPNATTMVYAALKQPGRGDRFAQMAPSSIGQAQSDESGRFRLDAVRTSSSIHEQAGAVAIAPGYGAGWVDLDLDADQPTADITLRPEQVIQGRLFDLQGRPVQGVSVSVAAMGRVLRDPEGDPDDYGLEGPDFLWGNHAKGLPAWPRPVPSDAEGRFIVRGAGRSLRVVLTIDDPRFARQMIKVDTDSTSNSKPVVMAVEPARIIFGASWRPTPENRSRMPSFPSTKAAPFETDADGRFRANPRSSDRYMVQVLAPQGQPYLNVRTQEFEWIKGTIEHQVDLVLPRGVMIRGKVTEEGSGKPIAGTMLGYLCGPTQAAPTDPWFGRAWSGPDGTFQLAVSPKSTYLIVLGPSEDYVLQEAGERMIQQGQPGGRRMYAHAFIAYDLKTGGDTRDVPVVLRRGLTVKGRVIGPDGQPVPDARMVSRFILMPSRGALAFLAGRIPRSRTQRPVRAAWPGNRFRGPRLLSRTEAKAGYPGESLGQVGIRRTGHRPPRVQRHGQGAARRLLGKADRGVSRPVSHRDGRHSRPVLDEPPQGGRGPPGGRKGLPLPDRSHQLPGWFCL